MLRHAIDKRTAVGTAATVLLAIAVLATLSGCGQEERDEAAPRATYDASLKAPSLFVSSDPAIRPVITSDVTAVDAWLDLVRRLEIGEKTDPGEYQDLLDSSAFRTVNDPRERNSLDRRLLRKIMEKVFAPRDTADIRVQRRIEIVASYTFLKNHLAEIAALNRDFVTANLLDDVRNALTRYVAPGDLPARISLHFFPGMPLIGYQEPDRFAVDVGLSLAAGRERFAPILASRLYLALAPSESVKTDFAQNSDVKLAAAFRRFCRGAIAGWLGEKTSIRFLYDHELLRDKAYHPTDLQPHARMTLQRVTEILGEIFEPAFAGDRDAAVDRIDKFLCFGERSETVGWPMARLIADHAGEDRLPELAGDTVAFLDAYQAAALAAETDGAVRSLPPFPAGVYEDLITHLRTH